MRQDVQKDWAWTKQFEPQASKILAEYLGSYVVRFVLSPLEKDQKEATDMYAIVTNGTVALRIRRPKYTFRDLTIRAYRTNGYETELQKILRGWARWYFYAWTDPLGKRILEWIIVDLNDVRTTGLLLKASRWDNHDGETGFVAVNLHELKRTNSLVATNLPPEFYEYPKEIVPDLPIPF